MFNNTYNVSFPYDSTTHVSMTPFTYFPFHFPLLNFYIKFWTDHTEMREVYLSELKNVYILYFLSVYVM